VSLLLVLPSSLRPFILLFIEAVSPTAYHVIVRIIIYFDGTKSMTDMG